MSTDFVPPQLPGPTGGRPRNRRRAARKPPSGQTDPAQASAPDERQPGPSRDPGQQRRRDRKPPLKLAHGEDGTSDHTRPSSAQSNTAGTKTDIAASRGPHRRGPPKPSSLQAEGKVDHDSAGSDLKHTAAKFRRAPRFNAGLSGDTPADSSDEKGKKRYGGNAKRDYAVPKKDDLTSILTYDLSTPPYPDCLICFSAIRPQEPTFSCSPSTPIAAAMTASDDEGQIGTSAVTAQCCWTTFHLKCIKAWATKSVKDTEAAWRARGEERQGVWRCPGCQTKRSIIPSVYRCFCGAITDPRPPRLSTPHSCASTCTRTRTCVHLCPLPCHPGPCPPCQVTTQMSCFCNKKTLTFRCGNLTQNRATSLSCGQVCDRPLKCGNHRCALLCHDGPCTPCEVRELARCYCGKEERELACGEGEEQLSVVIHDGEKEQWSGRFQCENECDRPFDCGIHKCSQRCHVPSPSPAVCPRSPSLVHTCPCGRHNLEQSSSVHFGPKAVILRTKCTDPVPTCDSVCLKPLDACSHLCASKCHVGPCPPCAVVLVRPCRCGSTTSEVRCYEDQARSRGELGEILCDKPCQALRACRKHHCNRLCCPLASLANIGKGKGKKKAMASENDAIVDDAGWHVCDLICGKTLTCGNHTCEEQDHSGPCPSCLRSSFDELICACGQTVLEPPIPCGTRIDCRFPCARPPPDCGHPKLPHACHEDPTPCPRCPFLTEKECACGKKRVPNVQCSQERVSCGAPCGKPLACGFHQCERSCHGDSCGPCHAVCGKPRKLCLPANHPCTLPCHAPAACSEAEPCRATITVTCPCGRIRQPLPCGHSTANPGGRESSQQLKCTDECLRAKRNARLAEALKINPEVKSTQVSYSDDLVAFAKANFGFCQLVEKTFADFVSSEKKSQILPHMPEARRNFVRNLALMYRMDTQMVDQEPHRSVQLIRRVDSRLPSPLLSAAVSANGAPPSLGRLTALRAPVPQRAVAGPSRPVPAAPASASGGRGWAVVAKPASSRASAAPSPTAWLTEGTPRNGSPSSNAPAPPRVQAPVVVVPAPAGDVPDDWEDDV